MTGMLQIFATSVQYLVDRVRSPGVVYPTYKNEKKNESSAIIKYIVL